MAKKSKVRRLRIAIAGPAKAPASKTRKPESKARKPESKARKEGASARKKTGALAATSTGGAKRPLARIALTAPLAKARKLSGDLYQSAGLALWAQAVEAAREPDRTVLIQLQDAICDAADLLREAKATNPKHLRLYWVACFDREGLPATPPRFITAAEEDEALQIFRAAFKDEIGRRKPRAHLVPPLAEKPALHE